MVNGDPGKVTMQDSGVLAYPMIPKSMMILGQMDQLFDEKARRIRLDKPRVR